MPRTPEQNAAIRVKQQTKILRQALKAFAIFSYNELAIDYIADACNFSHGLFYHYFSSKENVYEALLIERLKNHENWIFPAKEALNAGGLAGLKLILDFVHKTLRGPIEGVYYLKLDLMEDTINGPRKKRSHSIRGVMAKLIEEGQKAKEIRLCDPKSLANSLADACVGAIDRKISEKSEKTAFLESETILDLLRN